MTVKELQAALDREDDGVLKCGSHNPGREFCALEFDAKVRGREWSDMPITLPDLRPLNDAKWLSDQARTQALLPVMSALWNWAEWSPVRRQAWAARLNRETVRQIVAELPSLPDAVRQMCRGVETQEEAHMAAYAAAYAAGAAADAARAAARAADAARAAAYAADAARAAAYAARAAYAADAARAAYAADAARAAAYAARAADAADAAYAARAADAAARAADAAAAADAAGAAADAADAARAAARAAGTADTTEVPLRLACAIWIQAAIDTRGL